MIHENAHILSMASSQGDDDIATGFNWWANIIKKSSTCAPNYFAYNAGCLNDNSYLNLFFQKFWIDIYPSYKWKHEFDDYDEFIQHNAFYRPSSFVTGYASSNPDEDFAESFTAFVFMEKPRDPSIARLTIADQKILFFYDFPELVEMRDFIRSSLVEVDQMYGMRKE